MKSISASAKALDKMDRKILRILQKNGRIAMTELAEKVGLSTTPCTERVRRMERDGIIEGYYARLNPHALGGSLLVFVEIKLEAKSGNIFDAFRREIMSIPEILECHLVSGDFDYLIKARIPDMSMYRKLLGDILLQLPSAKESKSYVVMEEVKETLSLPLED
ncbi:DNA-binding transcriptional regulator, Lrp family [Chromobacterium violaceum]|uniref:Leucine-responsive regulatory protein n=3 Tax=Chromobacterium violaceum TaxID=536 RepID=Q7NWR7_CHRVO|nr:winged helix-turn-helix transcriptional regulator [Chromobacterium violaceum]AAQ59587.1 leucine-responsive regulatory protein [Chromobacterium violaceum ATCC 12472]ATP28505.1 AsnC family transcriptional regulator [Chromobacterium violaceum]ATP32415.1 AsnC family transcriptional regulator [Chromobacterium violaceum]KMN51027.1 AsnC family transcriptional regulator [Chromobacterium violaceum]KMN86306.1 AsnC family transcriptional regulator [Chromobacterium violaceum]